MAVCSEVMTDPLAVGDGSFVHRHENQMLGPSPSWSRLRRLVGTDRDIVVKGLAGALSKTRQRNNDDGCGDLSRGRAATSAGVLHGPWPRRRRLRCRQQRPGAGIIAQADIARPVRQDNWRPG
jgi:hypothetical protein